MPIRTSLRGLLAVLAITASGAAPTRADEQPAFPHEQQARLRQVEDQVVDVQRALFAARQRQDTVAAQDLGKQLTDLQRERKQLIRATAGQLPSE